MKCHSFVRGVVVSTKALGEANSIVNIYTESGLIYATAYGGRSLKSAIRGSNALFTMGRFALEQNKNHYYKIYDVLVHEHCYELSSFLQCYYTACTCVELVRYLEGSHHDMQFKTLVDVLLYLVAICRNKKSENDLHTYAALMVYLWRSLCCNGWHPQTIDNSRYENANCFILDMEHGVFVPYDDTRAYKKTTGESYISRQYIDILQKTIQKPFAYGVDYIYHASSQAQEERLRFAVKHLLYVWQQILERVLRSASFFSL